MHSDYLAAYLRLGSNCLDLGELKAERNGSAGNLQVRQSCDGVHETITVR